MTQPPQFCRRCGGQMQPGVALGQTYTGMSDFPGHEVVTLSAGGPGRLIDCAKCVECGHSLTTTAPVSTRSDEAG